MRAVLLALSLVALFTSPTVAFSMIQNDDDVEFARYSDQATGQHVVVRVEFMGSGFPGPGYLTQVVNAARVQQDLPGLEVSEEQSLPPDSLAVTGAEAGELYLAVETATALTGFVLVLVEGDDMIMIGFLGFDSATHLHQALEYAGTVLREGIDVQPPMGLTPGGNEGASAPSTQCIGATGAQVVAFSPLDGRLGGTLASFDAVYGMRSGSDLFPQYAIPGCGPVLLTDYEGSIVVTVMVFAPREGEEHDYFEADDADWSILEAMAIAESFLPPDTVFEEPRGDMSPPAPEMLGDLIEVRCSSQTLLEQVPAGAYNYVDNTPVYGGCSYWLQRTMSGDVSIITIQLAIEE